jgi:hypothetical protein
LDTSAHFERNGGSSANRSRLKALLRGGGHATSTQAEREWNRIVYTVCVTLRNALPISTDWTDVVRRLSMGYGRTAARAMQVTHWITGSDTTDFRIVATRLDHFQRIRARVLFKAGIGTVRDGTNCDVARRRPHYHAGQWHYKPQCKKTDDICDQPTFLAARREQAEKAARALLASERKADRKMGENALAALQGGRPEATKGKACHADKGIGGDIAIALECEEDEVLLTTDESFDLICPALGLKHLRL